MRRLFLSLLIFCSLPAWADNLDDLFKVAGWSDQRAHFNDALNAAQERYRSNLPPAVYQALVTNSSQRFNPQAMDKRAKDQMRKNLPDPAPATTSAWSCGASMTARCSGVGRGRPSRSAISSAVSRAI